MDDALYAERVKWGLINGKEYEGVILEQQNGYLGSVHEVAGPGSSAFRDHSSAMFVSIEEAKAFVISEWNKRANPA